MSGKNQAPIVFNWQSTSPIAGFVPIQSALANGSPASKVASGTMASTNTIYSQIICVANMDNIGIEVNWTGTPTGTLTVQVSNSGTNFTALTFSPTITQPAGTAATIGLNINQLPFRYLLLQYVNTSGSGVLTAVAQVKDLN